ncbi:hypothetical protein AB1Y20_010235 [Prymnesium parvum]|uniref:Cytosine-specific methyltransferase n=1 Tax=Prymnesium parvum TaxID=97485 RepID=A0AB34K6V1_PRYPA
MRPHPRPAEPADVPAIAAAWCAAFHAEHSSSFHGRNAAPPAEARRLLPSFVERARRQLDRTIVARSPRTGAITGLCTLSHLSIYALLAVDDDETGGSVLPPLLAAAERRVASSAAREAAASLYVLPPTTHATRGCEADGWRAAGRCVRTVHVGGHAFELRPARLEKAVAAAVAAAADERGEAPPPPKARRAVGQAEGRRLSAQASAPRLAAVDGADALCESLAHRAQPHGGVPVGAVLCTSAHAHLVKQLLELALATTLPIAISRPPDCPALLLFLPPPAAALFEPPPPPPAAPPALPSELAALLSSDSIRYLSGVRQCERRLAAPPPLAVPPACRFTFAEVFAGIGGFRLGLEPLGGRCAFACEREAAAAHTYRHNWPEEGGGDARPSPLFEGDILALPADELPPFDVLTGGFPCQTFSVRGEQQGTLTSACSWRGAMYLELVRLLRACRPRAFIFENVVGLVVMEGGERPTGKGVTFKAGATLTGMLGAFAACGYDVSWRVLNARHWLPQYRERLFIVGLRRDLHAPPMDWEGLTSGSGEGLGGSVEEGFGRCVADVLEEAEAAPVVDAELSREQWAVLQRQMESRGETLDVRSLPLRGKAPTLIASYRKVTNFTSKYVCHEIDGTPRDGVPPRRRPRFLTARECARLMGFPDSFRIPSVSQGPSGIFKQLGNAVCPPIVQTLGERVLRALENAQGNVGDC